MATELKPCPFCGGTKLKVDQKTSSSSKWNSEKRMLDKLIVVTVRCNRCHTRGPTTSLWGSWIDRPTETLGDKAIEVWNRRFTDEK